MNPKTIHTINIIYDSLQICTPSNPWIGINCNITKQTEKITPSIAINF